MLLDLDQLILPGKKEGRPEVEPLRFVRSKVTEGGSLCPD
jgi:hypothetical protein